MCPINASEINFEDDLRIVKAKLGLEEGKITNFQDLFKVIPETVIAKNININYVRFQAKVNDPSTFRVSELQALAKFLSIDFLKLVNIIYAPPANELEK